MFCPKCGNQMNDNDVFCGSCGSRVSTGANNNNLTTVSFHY